MNKLCTYHDFDKAENLKKNKRSQHGHLYSYYESMYVQQVVFCYVNLIKIGGN